MIRQKHSRWRLVVRTFELTLFLLGCLFVFNNVNKEINPNLAPEPYNTVIKNIVVETEASAAINREEKPKPSLMERNKERATEWLYSKTDVIPRSMAIEYVDFITHNVKPDLQPLVTALLTVESGGNPFALSPKGARGVTQIVFKYWGKQLIEQGFIKEERDLFDYKCNILSHQYIMNQLLSDTNGNIRKALVNYSGYKTAYAEKVLGRVESLKQSMSTGKVPPKTTSTKAPKKSTKKKR